MEVFFFVGLLFVILFSVILQLFFKSPLIVAGIIAIISLIIFAIFTGILGLEFIIWIIIYTITAFIVALITCRFFKHRHHNNDDF